MLGVVLREESGSAECRLRQAEHSSLSPAEAAGAVLKYDNGKCVVFFSSHLSNQAKYQEERDFRRT